ncbi:pou domain class 2 transcription factor [Anaeramoeba flamelloides]|uniref:Pou domain class 2 transcription factor n=1 Tax=Anaeramoeba flamelloides TaxID=1746091 RepID=A0AAV7YEV0_9EUKA|nr:pou domain class 2 transcription factor [Anaeramoeba flamelloides]
MTENIDKQKKRKFTTQNEREYLRKKFIVHRQPSRKMLGVMAEELNWQKKRVARWFSNQRARTPKQSKLLVEIESQKQIMSERKKVFSYSTQNSIDRINFFKQIRNSINEIHIDLKNTKDELKDVLQLINSNSLLRLENKIYEIERQLVIQQNKEEKYLNYLKPKTKNGNLNANEKDQEKDQEKEKEKDKRQENEKENLTKRKRTREQTSKLMSNSVNTSNGNMTTGVNRQNNPRNNQSNNFKMPDIIINNDNDNDFGFSGTKKSPIDSRSRDLTKRISQVTISPPNNVKYPLSQQNDLQNLAIHQKEANQKLNIGNQGNINSRNIINENQSTTLGWGIPDLSIDEFSKIFDEFNQQQQQQEQKIANEKINEQNILKKDLNINNGILFVENEQQQEKEENVPVEEEGGEEELVIGWGIPDIDIESFTQYLSYDTDTKIIN